MYSEQQDGVIGTDVKGYITAHSAATQFSLNIRIKEETKEIIAFILNTG